MKTQAHASFANHNGGALAYGPDGCLYAGIGDGGSGGDPDNNGQNLATLLGKIIRIRPTDGAPCPAAPGNPFVATAGARGEIWALGVRNPWRISFDRQTGDLIIADVGQNTREEVNVQPAGSAGLNYCWRRMEGTLIYDATVPCTVGTPTDPVLEYSHIDGNCSITGGYRYRGSQFPVLTGTYFYADFCSGRIWGATQSAGTWSTTEFLQTTLNITSFGEDEAGEIYFATLAGEIHRFAVTSLQVLPASDMAAAGPQGGPFAPSSFSYALKATAGSVGFSITGVPNWLTPSTTSGTLTTSPTSVTFTLNGNANGFASGTSTAGIVFTNTTNTLGTQNRAATLVVNAVQPSSIVAAVLPYARSVPIGQQASAFGVAINTGQATAIGCSVGLPSGLAGAFVYQTTNAANQLTGVPNTPADIALGGAQHFVFGYTPSAALSAREIAVSFTCANTPPAPSIAGVNTFIVSAAGTPTPDIVAIGATSSGDGIVGIAGNTGTGFFAAAGINIGAGATITASADDGGRGLPIVLSICQSDPNTAVCLSPATASTTTTFNANAIATYSIFVRGTAFVPFDPANNRLFLRFKDAAGVTRGATGVAVRTF